MKVTENMDSLDRASFHLSLYEYKKANGHQTYLEALLAFLSEYDLEPEDILELITPTMRELLYKDALDANLMKDKSNNFQIDNLF